MIVSFHFEMVEIKLFHYFLFHFFFFLFQQQEQDPTNLYISNLPHNIDEKALESMLSPIGHVISTRILRDTTTHDSRGVGFAR